VQPEVPAATYAARMQAALARAKTAGMDALVVYGDREHSANIAYLSGYDPRFEEALLVAPTAAWPRQPASLFTAAAVSDRSDGKIAHLDGLNLSRAWCWHGIAAALAADDAARGVITATADAHLAAGLPHIAGDYAGEHWLATFALLALGGV